MLELAGPAELAARLEVYLSTCRRRGGVLALLSVGEISVGGADGVVEPTLAKRVREEVSHRIVNAVRGSDALLHEPGGGTCVVLPGADEAVAARVRRRLERAINGDYRVAGELLHVTVRIGAAAHPEHGGRAADLLRWAGGGD